MTTWKRTMLVVANVTATSTELVGVLKERAAGAPATFTLVIPAVGGRVAAHSRLAEALEHLRERGLEVDGSVGHTDPLVAVTEAWDPTRYDEIIVSTLPPDISKWLGAGLPRRIAMLTGAPVTHVVSRPPRPPAPVAKAPAHGRGGATFDPVSVLRRGAPHEARPASIQARTIAEHEAEHVAQANASDHSAGGVHPWLVAAAQQLGPMGERLRGGRVRGAHPRLAR